MATENHTRKLATIVALDVAGYSAQTEAGEAHTTSEVASLRKNTYLSWPSTREIVKS